MCGIVGKLDRDGPISPDLIHRMCNRIIHRGPDSEGVFVNDGIGLGMRRLAIIDVAGGQQPIFNEDRTIVTVMNGEIYNFLALRRDLEAKGHSFNTNSDTEVIVHLYEEYGSDLCRFLEGMFAFAVWDTRERKLLLGRDRVGKKPLFWSDDGKSFSFASEIGALLADPALDRTIDDRAIAAFLAYQFVPGPMSAFKAIRKLQPGTTMTVSSRGIETERYWRLEYDESLESVSYPELKEMLMKHLRDAVKKRLMSEVPLGAFLSGGIDSSAVVALMAEMSTTPVKTFSIDFEVEGFSEMPWADEVAAKFGTEHHRFTTKPSAFELLPKMVRHYGEPFADPAALPTFQLSELTRTHVTVALNGDGGDESFAGYRHHQAISGLSPGLSPLWRTLIPRVDRLPESIPRAGEATASLLGRSAPEQSLRAKAMRLTELIAMRPASRYAASLQAFRRSQRAAWFAPSFIERLGEFDVDSTFTELWHAPGRKTDLDSMLGIDVDVVLADQMLVKVDVATMAYSLEGRSPFLDHHLMEFAAKLPACAKIRGGQGKAILIDSLRGVVPDSVLDRPKAGFSVPLERWLREEQHGFVRELLLADDSHVSRYVRRDALERMLNEHSVGSGEHSRRLWALLQLETWHREVVDSKPGDEWS